MPLYEYKCEECGEILESLVCLGVKKITCDCGGTAHKIISASNFQLKGGGWEADGYSNAKGAKDCNKSKGG